MPKNTLEARHLKSHQFKTDKEESCTKQISLRVPPSIKAKLDEKKGWQDAAREFLAEYTADIELESA